MFTVFLSMDLYDNLSIFLDAHRQRIVNWINAIGGTSSAFDVTTKVPFILHLLHPILVNSISNIKIIKLIV
jgi:hypothetical protein